jgi:nucleoside-diphosphate kinase
VGATNPKDSAPGSIRGGSRFGHVVCFSHLFRADFCIEVGRNIIHGSDSVESAQKEIALW